jgi:hypothetical protein
VATWKQILVPARPSPKKNPYDTTSAIFTMSKKFATPIDFYPQGEPSVNSYGRPLFEEKGGRMKGEFGRE